MKKYIIEFIGTFFLVFVIALTSNPLAIGLILTALVYMGGYISGANYNPAVTLGLWINKKINFKTAYKYMLIQLVASIAASFVYSILFNNVFMPKIGSHANLFSALIIEILFTFILVTVVLHTAASEKTKGNNYFGIAIGFTVAAIAFAGGPISGGAFNPAVGIGPIIYDIANLNSHFMILFLYLIGPFLGGTFAGLLFKMK